MKDIEVQFLEDLKSALYARREEAINEEARLRESTLEEIGAPLSMRTKQD